MNTPPQPDLSSQIMAVGSSSSKTSHSLKFKMRRLSKTSSLCCIRILMICHALSELPRSTHVEDRCIAAVQPETMNSRSIQTTSEAFAMDLHMQGSIKFCTSSILIVSGIVERGNYTCKELANSALREANKFSEACSPLHWKWVPNGTLQQCQSVFDSRVGNRAHAPNLQAS